MIAAPTPMYRLRNRIQPYAWGSRTAIASLLGARSPSDGPQAELWMGDHPGAPSFVDGEAGAARSLVDCIGADPIGMLGAKIVERFGPRLPFLFKVLAADQPLSLQAHPNLAQAQSGFDREEAAGIPLSAPHRNYKDRSHKPELLCAVTPFDALWGFRDPSRTRELFAGLSVAGLGPLLAPLDSAPPGEALSNLFVSLLSLERSRAADLANEVGMACRRESRAGGPYAAEYAWGARIAELYPGDVGIAVALLLNLVRLAPGEAIYLPAGNLHAYLQGVGVEIMASSDNVLRGGLTPKHVDVPELCRVVRFEATEPEPLAPWSRGSIERVYATPAAEFCLSRLALTDSGGAAGGGSVWTARDRCGPEILLCWEGALRIDDGAGRREELTKGQSLFICASAGRYSVSGRGVLFRAAVGALA